MSAYEQWCAQEGLRVLSTTPCHVSQFLRQIAQHGETVCWRELCAISELFSSVGLSDPTLSPLVIGEFDKHFPTPLPRGWTAQEANAWSRIPKDLKQVITKRRADDISAVRQCQHLNRWLEQQSGDKSAATAALIKEMNNHARASNA
jgi:hypothetical protein